MSIKLILLTFATFCLSSNYAIADARLEKKLGLNIDKARQAQEIQKKYRQKFRVKRQELHKENRKLRRARNNNDSTVISQQQQITEKLKRSSNSAKTALGVRGMRRTISLCRLADGKSVVLFFLFQSPVEHEVHGILQTQPTSVLKL